MTTTNAPDESPAVPSIEGGSITWVPLTLVVTSLMLLVAVPLLLQGSIDAAREEVADAAEPARPLVAIIRGSLLFESAGARAFALTGDPEFAAAHRESQARRIEAETALLPLTARLGGALDSSARSLVADIEIVDATLDSVYDGSVLRTAYRDRAERTQTRLASALAQASALDRQLIGAANERRERIRNRERLGMGLTVALAGLALFAAFLVGRLGRRYRLTAIKLDRRRAELERITQSRARLIRGFSHDVKNPLGAADGFLALLEEGIYGPLDPPQTTSVAKARRSIHRALDLIQYLLDLARAETGQLELHPQSLAVGDLVSEVAEEFRAQAHAAHLELRCEVSEALPLIETDPDRARQVLANLLSNAIKYTREGTVSVRVGARAFGDGRDRRSWIAIDVEDSGVGITAEQIKMLFSEFTRFRPEAAQGTGVGLAISQRLAAALGGRITVESEPGRGSTFTFWLPLRPR